MKQTNKWLVALTVVMPTFIEVLDTSVVNVALDTMGGSLSASLNETTWVSTSYLIANAIIVPLTVWLSRLLGRKRYLMASIALFTLSSFLCGTATSLGAMILFRILQGIGGGGLMALSLSILMETFPPEEHGIATAIYGIGTLTAPALGPVLGGWVVNNWSWPWIFFINIPVGILALIMTQVFIEDPSYLQRTTFKEKLDYWGIILVVIGVACLQIVLSKGQDMDWFASTPIAILTVVSAVSLAAFVAIELKSPHPILNLRVFKDACFTSANVISGAAMLVMFSSFIFLPIFLQQLMSYDAFQAGLAVTPLGIVSMFSMMAAGLLVNKINPKIIVVLGILSLATSSLMMSRFNLYVDPNAIIWPVIFMGAGLGMVMVPLVAMMYVTLPKTQVGDASSIFNVLRNIASSMGVAVMVTLLSRRAQFHQFRLIEHLSPFDATYQSYVHQASSLVAAKTGFASELAANGLIYQGLMRQAALFAFTDIFYISAIIMLCMIPLIFLLKRPKHGQGGMMMH
ncbi:MAG: DHA2 family efflux MFS transporter permease subunit [Candidatus Brocadiia bacterium]